jgi:hypothetical protein
MELVYALVIGLVLFAIWRMWRDRHGVIERDRPDPGFDPSEGQPEVAEARAMLEQGDWRELTRLYGRLSPSDRFHLIASLGALKVDPPAPPEDADSALLTLVGGLLLFRGMQLDGSGPLVSVARASVPRMREQQAEAERLLREADLRNANDSTNLALQMLRDITRQDVAHINNLVGRVQAAGEDNIYAAYHHLLSTSPRMGGSTGKMWKVANEWANAGPNGAWLAIPARAHIEEWSYAMQVSPHASAERSDMIDRLQDDGFRRHVARLDDMFWAALARTPINGAEASFAHNHFALLMHVFNIDGRAKAHLERIGPYIARDPWRLLPTGARHPSRMLADLRRQYGLPQLDATGRDRG